MKTKASLQGKTDVVKARVTPEMKQQIAQISDRRGESEGVIVREAIRQYFTRRKPGYDLPTWNGSSAGSDETDSSAKRKTGRPFATK